MRGTQKDKPKRKEKDFKKTGTSWVKNMVQPDYDDPNNLHRFPIPK